MEEGEGGREMRWWKLGGGGGQGEGDREKRGRRGGGGGGWRRMEKNEQKEV